MLIQGSMVGVVVAPEQRAAPPPKRAPETGERRALRLMLERLLISEPAKTWNGLQVTRTGQVSFMVRRAGVLVYTTRHTSRQIWRPDYFAEAVQDVIDFIEQKTREGWQAVDKIRLDTKNTEAAGVLAALASAADVVRPGELGMDGRVALGALRALVKAGLAEGDKLTGYTITEAGRAALETQPEAGTAAGATESPASAEKAARPKRAPAEVRANSEIVAYELRAQHAEALETLQEKLKVAREALDIVERERDVYEARNRALEDDLRHMNAAFADAAGNDSEINAVRAQNRTLEDRVAVLESDMQVLEEAMDLLDEQYARAVSMLSASYPALAVPLSKLTGLVEILIEIDGAMDPARS